MGFAAGSGQSVSTEVRRMALPYCLVVRRADFPIQPSPARVAIVLWGRKVDRVLRSKCSVVGSIGKALNPRLTRIKAANFPKSDRKRFTLLYSSK